MSTRSLILVLMLSSAAGALIHAQAPPVGRTVWDGVYTDAQAARATATFNATCSNCHTLSAQGNKPLSGDAFWQGFTQKTVGELLTYVKTNMPNGVNAGSLSASAYNDLVALILKSNGFPTGTTEVTPEAVVGVQIIPREGPGQLPADTLVRIVGCLTKEGSDWVLTSATAPQRAEKTGALPEDATRPLGTGKTKLKFVLTRLDPFAGQRMSASGLLIGAGGVDGLNVTTVNRVAETCP
jgi:mono/diheme cytochrome c family protein